GRAAGPPLPIPGRPRTGADPMSLTPPLNGALIGCGHVAQYHLEAWKHVPDARLVAVCDLLPERLEWAATIVPEARRYPGDEAMFEAEERLDFVEICTLPESHRELVDLAARRGAHILCQKPAAVVRPDLRAMIGTCDEAGVRLMIHENWRYRPWYR